MTWMHQKQTIEDCVKDQVLEWDLQNSRDVYLTCGYGPALPWKLYEFKPRTNELTGQFQYLQDPTTGTTVRQQKYAPPFGLTKLDTSDDRHFDTYLELLLRREYLWDFGWTCFEEETQIDDFQARLLELVCKLYTNAQDYDVSAVRDESECPAQSANGFVAPRTSSKDCQDDAHHIHHGPRFDDRREYSLGCR